MTPTVCLTASTLGYPAGGGHRWAYVNWALGLRRAGCDVLWMESIEPGSPDQSVASAEAALRGELEQFGLADALALYDERDEKAASAALETWESRIDLLLTLSYGAPPRLLQIARRSAMIDIDPGPTQLWIRAGAITIPRHDMYFTIGEAARSPGDGLPDCGIHWHYTPPSVDLEAWPPAPTNPRAPYTTVSHWWPDGWIELQGDWIENSKRAGFAPYVDLPSRTDASLELALGGLESPEDAHQLRSCGWRVRDAWTVTSSMAAYASYIRQSRGEFSCVKPSYARLEPGWISDRTLCYLASGKPAVVEYAGELDLPEPGQGLLQFRTPEEAVQALTHVEEDYERHGEAARRLAERFDARKVAAALLEKVLA